MSGGAALGLTLASNRFITILNLSDNRLGRECTQALAEMVEYNSTLENLNLSGTLCHVDDRKFTRGQGDGNDC